MADAFSSSSSGEGSELGFCVWNHAQFLSLISLPSAIVQNENIWLTATAKAPGRTEKMIPILSDFMSIVDNLHPAWK